MALASDAMRVFFLFLAVVIPIVVIITVRLMKQTKLKNLFAKSVDPESVVVNGRHTEP